MVLMEMECVETNITNNIPRIGMQFDSEEDAYMFYNNYGGSVGFSVRKDYHNKSLKDGVLFYRKYVCCKEGQRSRDQRNWKATKSRAETRTNCLAHMCISLKRDIQKFVIVKWEDKHNHLLHVAECVHMMSSQRKKVMMSMREARKLCSVDFSATSNEEDLKLMAAARYRQLYPKMVQLAAHCSNLKLAYQLVNRSIDELFKQVEIMYASLSNEGNGGDDGNGGVKDHASFQNTCVSKGVKTVDLNILRVKGLKRKNGDYKGWSQLKPWYEKQAKKKIGTSHRSKVSQPIVSMSDEQNSLSCEHCAHSNPLSSQVSNGQKNV